MADLTNQPIDRSKQTDNMTSLGTAFFAGLAVGRCNYEVYSAKELMDPCGIELQPLNSLSDFYEKKCSL